MPTRKQLALLLANLGQANHVMCQAVLEIERLGLPVEEIIKPTAQARAMLEPVRGLLYRLDEVLARKEEPQLLQAGGNLKRILDEMAETHP